MSPELAQLPHALEVECGVPFVAVARNYSRGLDHLLFSHFVVQTSGSGTEATMKLE